MALFLYLCRKLKNLSLKTQVYFYSHVSIFSFNGENSGEKFVIFIAFFKGLISVFSYVILNMGFFAILNFSFVDLRILLSF